MKSVNSVYLEHLYPLKSGTVRAGLITWALNFLDTFTKTEKYQRFIKR